MRILIYLSMDHMYHYAKHERYDRVTFDCSAEEVKVEKPLIVCKMKNSIVVECADNQQYICMEKEKDAPTEVDWNGDNVKDSDWTDDIGNIEFETGLQVSVNVLLVIVTV